MSCSPTAPVLGGIVVATVLAVAAMLPASADVRIRSSPGGAVEAYLAAFARVRQSGQRVVIDGPCLSACTLVLPAAHQSCSGTCANSCSPRSVV